MNDKNGVTGKQDISICRTLKMLLGFIWQLDKVYYLVLAFLSLTNAANAYFCRLLKGFRIVE